MFGGKTVKVKLDRDLVDKLRKVADIAGYANDRRSSSHILEKEMLHFEVPRTTGRGASASRLGYIN
jgi:hypothetical protein